VLASLPPEAPEATYFVAAPECGGSVADIFISHTREDRERTAALARALEDFRNTEGIREALKTTPPPIAVVPQKLQTSLAVVSPSHRGLLLVAVVWCTANAMLTTSGCAAQRGPGVQTVDAVDVDRYVGTWFEIARFPNRFQDRCIGGVTATYTLRSDGHLDVINRCQTDNGAIEARGVARIVDTETRARLKVRFAPAVFSFLPFVWGDYWILGLGHDYSWAVVGSPDRAYLWILARAPALDWERYTLALATAAANGFAVERLINTPQSAGRARDVARYEERANSLVLHAQNGRRSAPSR